MLVCVDEILIFSKAPLAGCTKTRMMPFLSGEQCAELHVAILADLLEQVRQLQLTCPNLLVKICYQAENAQVFREIFLEQLAKLLKRWQLPAAHCQDLADFLAKQVDYSPQAKGDLGFKMAAAFAEVLPKANRVILLGSDCPQISKSLLATAFDQVVAGDLVLGAANDGGYYLVGLKHPSPQLFEAISWSTPKVLAETLGKAKTLGCQSYLLEELIDLDEKADLQELAKVIEKGEKQKKNQAPMVLTKKFLAEVLQQVKQIK